MSAGPSQQAALSGDEGLVQTQASAAQETPCDLAGCDTEEPMAHPDFNFTGVTITNPNARNPKDQSPKPGNRILQSMGEQLGK